MDRSAKRLIEGLAIAPLAWGPAFLSGMLFDQAANNRGPYTGGFEIAIAGVLIGTMAAYVTAATAGTVVYWLRTTPALSLFTTGILSVAISSLGATLVTNLLAAGRTVAAGENWRLSLLFSFASLCCCFVFALHQRIRNPLSLAILSPST